MDRTEFCCKYFALVSQSIAFTWLSVRFLLILRAQTWITSVQWNSVQVTVKKTKYTLKCLIPSTSNVMCYQNWGVPRISLDEANIWSFAIILLTSFLSRNCLEVISPWNCLHWVKWIILSTAALSTKFSKINGYCGLDDHRSISILHEHTLLKLFSNLWFDQSGLCQLKILVL